MKYTCDTGGNMQREFKKRYLKWQSHKLSEKTDIQKVGFEVLTAVVMKNTIFWDITLCSPLV
jgi:hypothetical protein